MPVYWPDTTGIVAGCDRNSARMSQDCWPDVAGILNLTSETGLVLRSQRAIEPETVFGDIKGNSHPPILIGGLKKVN